MRGKTHHVFVCVNDYFDFQFYGVVGLVLLIDQSQSAASCRGQTVFKVKLQTDDVIYAIRK